MATDKKTARATDARNSGRSLIASNRKARHDYAIIDTFEAGISLTGTEVKSLRAGRASLVDGFATVSDDEVWLRNVHITEYAEGTWTNHAPRRARKLLLHRAEIDKLMQEKKRGNRPGSPEGRPTIALLARPSPSPHPSHPPRPIALPSPETVSRESPVRPPTLAADRFGDLPRQPVPIPGACSVRRRPPFPGRTIDKMLREMRKTTKSGELLRSGIFSFAVNEKPWDVQHLSRQGKAECSPTPRQDENRSVQLGTPAALS